jgi:hypothetical protein
MMNKGEKTKFNEGIINRDFPTNSRELTFTKLNKSVSMVKQIFSFIFGSGWCIGRLEIRERQVRHVNNQISNVNSKVT